jgi:hypothetical protein
MSTDGSREIARKYPKVVLIDNPSETFNEPERQKLLIREARKIEGSRLLVTLDADEIFTPNILHSAEWLKVLNCKPGTIFKFQWANLRPNFKTFWNAGYFLPLGYMDDGHEHNHIENIHSARIPLPIGTKVIEIESIKVMHFQYVNLDRMQSKHRWYQCYECVTFPEKSSLDIFRMYHHMYSTRYLKFISIPLEWLQDYHKLGIDLTSLNVDRTFWWDIEVLNYIELYGALYFKQLHIWDIDWKLIAKVNGKENTQIYKDPRSLLDKIIQYLLIKTQMYIRSPWVQKMDRILKKRFNY